MHSASSTKPIDDDVRFLAHASLSAIIADLKQAENCDISICDYRTTLEHGRMDADEIRARLKARGLKQVDLANFVGLDQNKLTKVLKGERRFKVEEMDKVRAFFTERAELPSTDLRPIPLVGTIPGGNWREAVKQSLHSIPSPDPSIPSRAFALKVSGDSMDLYVDDGGTIIVDPDDVALFPNKFYAVANGEGETTFKQYKADPPRLVPCSTNAQHSETLIGSQPFTVIGRIIWRAARM